MFYYSIHICHFSLGFRYEQLIGSNLNHWNFKRFYGFCLVDDGGFGFSFYFCSWIRPEALLMSFGICLEHH